MIMIDRSAVKEHGRKLIVFPDVDHDYRPMFYLEDGKTLTVRTNSGSYVSRPCTYIDAHHFYYGNACFHIDEFAELNQRNGNTCLPPDCPTDLFLFTKFYADRSLQTEDGKKVPYYALLGFDPDCYGSPGTLLGICPQAANDRQVCFWKKDGENITKEFSSIEDAPDRFLSRLPLDRYESKLVRSVLDSPLQAQLHAPLSAQISHAKQRKTPAEPARIQVPDPPIR